MERLTLACGGEAMKWEKKIENDKW
jgi:hypothetical protein